MRVHVDPQFLSSSIGGAFACGEHSPRRANSSNCKQSVTPLETPPRHAGNTIVSGCSRFRSANQIAKMTNLASYFLASNGCEIELDPRHLRPDYRPLAQPLQGAVFWVANVDLNGESRRLGANRRGILNTHALVRRGLVLRNAAMRDRSSAARIRIQALDRGSAIPPSQSRPRIILFPNATRAPR